MTLQIISKLQLRNNIIKDHIVVILIFIAFTGYFTYPTYFAFDKLIGSYHGDPTSWMNPFWWYQHNLQNPSGHFDLHWLFYNNYQFYPSGTPINEYGLLAAWSSIILMPLLHDNVVHVYNFLMCTAFIFTGYGTFLLAKHLTKNYYASIVAGLIFTFGIYHMYHGNGHLSYTMTQFVPFAMLYIIKSKESHDIKNPIIGGIFLFLVLGFSLYIGFFMLFFVAGYFLYLLYTKSNLQTFLRFGLIILIGLSMTLPIYYGHYAVEGKPQVTPPSQYVALSNELESFILPSPRNILYNALDFPIKDTGSAETWNFLGYTAIFLTIIALIKIEKDKKLLWLIPGILVGLVSLGPVFKIFGHPTAIHLPYYYLYQFPYFDIFRAVGRGGLFVTLSVSILAAYGMTVIWKLNSISKNKKIIIMGAIGILVFAELLTPPLIHEDITVPKVYYQIAKDHNSYAVLEAPIGRYTEANRYHLETNHLTAFYQTIHDKPIYSGLIPRIPENNERYVQTYFLNQFIWFESQNDIVKQNINDTGIGLFNYFHIGYVIVRNSMEPADPQAEKFVKTTWFPKMKSLLHGIFAKPPIYQDKELFAYKVPRYTSKTPFLALGQDWSPFLNFYRTFAKQGTVIAFNPTDKLNESELQMTLVSPVQNKIHFILNGNETYQADLEPMVTYYATLDLKLKPGENTLVITSEKVGKSEISTMPYLSTISSLNQNVGMAVDMIKLDSTIISNNSVTKLDNDTFSSELSLYSQINKVYNKMLERGATPHELDVFSNRLLTNSSYPLKDALMGGSEYKQLHTAK